MPIKSAFLEAACACPVVTCATCGMRPQRQWTAEEAMALENLLEAAYFAGVGVPGSQTLIKLVIEAKKYTLGPESAQG
jgi:hypothetical protein